jgi:diguanylate cyclase (GGDEF)-like protein
VSLPLFVRSFSDQGIAADERSGIEKMRSATVGIQRPKPIPSACLAFALFLFAPCSTNAVTLFLGAGSLLSAQSIPKSITTAAEVRRLGPEEARKESAVSIRAVVTYVNTQTGELFVQDNSAGIFVFIRSSTSDVPLRAGQLVNIEGVTVPGDFSSSIAKARITVIGRSDMPRPVHLPFDQILTGEQDSQWGHLVGVVRLGRQEKGVLYLNAVTSGGAFLIIMKDYPADWATTLVDSKVSLDGVLAAVFNDHRQVAGVRIFVPSRGFLHIDERAPASPFDLPESSALSVGAFRTKQDWSHRIRVRGNVTAVLSRSLIYVSEGEGNLPVELWMPCLSKPGSLVDVVGFPSTIDGRAGLQNAVCRFVADGGAVRPVEVLAREIVPPQVEEDGSGIVIAKGTRDDLKLITVAGTLIQVVKGMLSQTLTLVSGDQTFSVTVPASAAWVADALEPATQLKVTGVCLITFDEYHRAQSFRLLARESADIVIVSRPSWLTLRRALWMMLPLVLVMVGSMVWISFLRRHVATKTIELRAANERLRQISVEDALTGAANRRRFDDVIEDKVRCCLRTAMPLSLVMIDIDHFKRVNDTYGHQRGDQYLILVASALRRALIHLPNALVARYGGEEFAVLLPNTCQDTAAVIAEEMCASVRDMAIPQQHYPLGQRQTVSLGVATMPPGLALDPGQLVNMADRALYQAKESGRNRVVVFDAGVPADRRTAAALNRLSTMLRADTVAAPGTLS